jgi:hypothetical protein
MLECSSKNMGLFAQSLGRTLPFCFSRTLNYWAAEVQE